MQRSIYYACILHVHTETVTITNVKLHDQLAAIESRDNTECWFQSNIQASW